MMSLISAVLLVAFQFTTSHLELIRAYPHLLGHMVGKTKLTELHSAWIHDTWDSPDHTSLQAHRGAYKTTAITEIGSIYWLLFHPDDRIAIIRKPYTEAAKTLGTIKQYFQQDAIRALFTYAHGTPPKFIRKADNTLQFSFKRTITKEGSIDAYGVDGNITGNHYDKIDCDDIITLKDRISRAERARTLLGIQEILTNIIDPGKQCLFVGTPWHRDDGWSACPPAMKYDVDATRILSADEIIQKRKTTSPVLFNINYMLNHTADDDAVFTDPAYQAWDYATKQPYAHIDAKFDGDCTGALTFMGERPDGKKGGVGFTFEDNVVSQIQWIKKKYQSYRARGIFVETNPDKGYTADLLAGAGMNVIRYHEDMNKDIKIQTFLKDEWNNILWAPETDDSYMVQITDYREGEKPNDAPDSASSLLRKKFSKKGGADALYIM